MKFQKVSPPFFPSSSVVAPLFLPWQIGSNTLPPQESPFHAHKSLQHHVVLTETVVELPGFSEQSCTYFLPLLWLFFFALVLPWLSLIECVSLRLFLQTMGLLSLFLLQAALFSVLYLSLRPPRKFVPSRPRPGLRQQARRRQAKNGDTHLMPRPEQLKKDTRTQSILVISTTYCE